MKFTKWRRMRQAENGKKECKRWKTHDSFKKPKQKGHLGDFADLNEIRVRMSSEFISLRIGSNSGFSRTWWWTTRYHESKNISQWVKQLLSSQDGIGCIQFVHNTLESTSYPEQSQLTEGKVSQKSCGQRLDSSQKVCWKHTSTRASSMMWSLLTLSRRYGFVGCPTTEWKKLILLSLYIRILLS